MYEWIRVKGKGKKTGEFPNTPPLFGRRLTFIPEMMACFRYYKISPTNSPSETHFERLGNTSPLINTELLLISTGSFWGEKFKMTDQEQRSAVWG